jgi:hypothetical protein
MLSTRWLIQLHSVEAFREKPGRDKIELVIYYANNQNAGGV